MIEFQSTSQSNADEQISKALHDYRVELNYPTYNHTISQYSIFVLFNLLPNIILKYIRIQALGLIFHKQYESKT